MSDKSVKTKQPAHAEKRARVDWPAVERDYRTSQMTLRELGEKYGCTHGAIAQKAKADKWSRDLRPAIEQATQTKLIEAALTNALSSATQELTTCVLAAAEINTNVILGHRKGLRDITSVRDMLLSQVAEAAANLPALAEVIELVRSEDDRGIDKANDALKKALGRSALVDDLKKLAEIDEKVRKGEREAFGIGDAGDDPGSKPTKRVVLDFIDAVAR